MIEDYNAQHPVPNADKFAAEPPQLNYQEEVANFDEIINATAGIDHKEVKDIVVPEEIVKETAPVVVAEKTVEAVKVVEEVAEAAVETPAAEEIPAEEAKTEENTTE